MASALSLLGQGAMWKAGKVNKTVALGTMMASTAVGFGGSVALGEIYARYSDKWYGKYAPEMLGGTGKVLEAILTATIGSGLASGVVGALGQVGINAIGLELGLNHARKAMGIACVKVPAGTDVKKLKKGDKVPESIAVGMLPGAAAGHGLGWDHIQDLASSH